MDKLLEELFATPLIHLVNQYYSFVSHHAPYETDCSLLGKARVFVQNSLRRAPVAQVISAIVGPHMVHYFHYFVFVFCHCQLTKRVYVLGDCETGEDANLVGEVEYVLS